MSIIFPSYKVIEETITTRPYYIIVPSFYAFSSFTKFIIHAYVMERWALTPHFLLYSIFINLLGGGGSSPR